MRVWVQLPVALVAVFSFTACARRASDPELTTAKRELAQLNARVSKLEQAGKERATVVSSPGSWQLIATPRGDVYLLSTRTGDVFERQVVAGKTTWVAIREDSESLKLLQSIHDLLKPETPPAQTTTVTP